MARIPTRDSVRELPAGPGQLPGVRMTAAPDAQDLGARRGLPNEGARRDARSALDHLSEASDIIQRRRDNTQVMTVLAEAQKASALKQVEIEQREGAFAEGATKDVETWYAEQEVPFRDRLANERQKRAFEENWLRLKTNTVVAASQHEAREGRKAGATAANAMVSGAIELAAKSVDDPQALAGYRDSVITGSRNAAAMKGYRSGSGPAILEELKNLSAFHESVINNLATNDPARAEEYFAAHGREINDSTTHRVEKTVKGAVSVRKAQAFADGVMGAGLSEADAVKRAREQLSGDDEVRAVIEIKTRWAERTQARERQQRTAADQAWQVYSQAGNPNLLPPELVAQLDGRDLEAIRSHHTSKLASAESRAASRETRAFTAEQRLASADAREAAKKDRDRGGVYLDLRRMAMTAPEEFVAMDLRRHTAQLGPSQMESLIDIQGQIAKPAAPKDPTHLDVVTHLQQVNKLVDKLGMSGDKKAAADFEQQADAAVRAEQIRVGRRLNQDERQKVLDRLVMDVKLPGFLWGTNAKPAYKVTADEVPKVEADKITKKLQAAGLPVTPDSIRQVFVSAGGVR